MKSERNAPKLKIEEPPTPENWGRHNLDNVISALNKAEDSLNILLEKRAKNSDWVRRLTEAKKLIYELLKKLETPEEKDKSDIVDFAENPEVLLRRAKRARNAEDEGELERLRGVVQQKEKQS